MQWFAAIRAKSGELRDRLVVAYRTVASPNVWWWLPLLILLGALWMWTLGISEASVRRLGFAYEFLGLLAVFYELNGIRKRHELKTLWSRAAKYWAQVLLLRSPKQEVSVGYIAVELAPLTGSAYGTTGCPPDWTVEQRLSHLEATASSLGKGLFDLGEQLQEEKRERKNALKAEAAERKQRDDALHRDVVRVEVEGLDWAVLGLLVILMGTTLDTLTTEVLSFMQAISLHVL